jgi:hypothetical protein
MLLHRHSSERDSGGIERGVVEHLVDRHCRSVHLGLRRGFLSRAAQNTTRARASGRMLIPFTLVCAAIELGCAEYINGSEAAAGRAGLVQHDYLAQHINRVLGTLE